VIGRILSVTAAVAVAAGGIAAAPAARAGTSASATTAVTAPGSILYIKSHDVYLTDSTGSATIRITHTGAHPTADHTGGVGFVAPSQSADGSVVVAARNQSVAGADGAEQGWIWVLRRDGTVIRKFRPFQIALIGGLTGCVGGKYRQFPLGILNMKVSPNGKKIAFDEKFDVVGSGSCQAAQSYATFVVNIDGTHGRMIKRANGDGSFLELGQWAGNGQLLLDDVEFDAVQDFYAEAPGFTATPWFGAPDDIDTAYGQPELRAGKLATTGFSEFTRNDIGAPLSVVRFWNADGPPSEPAPICEYRATAGGPTDGEFGADLPRAADTSLAPDGTAAVWDEIQGSRMDRPDEGLYVVQLPAGSLSGANPCPFAKQELVPGAMTPSWSAAPLHVPVTGGIRVSVRPRLVLGSTHAIGAHHTVRRLLVGHGVPLGASAAILRITVVRPSRSGGLVVWPDGRRRPAKATVTFAAHQSVTRTRTVRLGANGRIAFYNQSPAPVHVRALLVGYLRGTA
jgi:hypothetical protein